MNKRSGFAAAKIVIFTLLISTTILAATKSLNIALAQDTTPALNMIPSTVTILSINGTVTVNITVTEVEDLYMWQIKVFFNKTLLSCESASYPTDHVFAGKPLIPMTPVIENTAGWVGHGCSLSGDEPGFNGNGTLCQITFKGLAEGVSSVAFSQPYGEDTFLYDSLAPIEDVDMNDGSITIIPEFPLALILPIFMVITFVAVVFTKKIIRKSRPAVSYVGTNQ